MVGAECGLRPAIDDGRTGERRGVPVSGASKTAILILVIIGIANFAYAAYRAFTNMEGSSLPLIIGGVVCLTLSAALMARSKKG